VKRSIIEFGTDEAGDPFAQLDCGHLQHVRHRPPFVNRPWVTSEVGRKAMLGSKIECPLCDRMQWPQGLVNYKRTRDLSDRSVPAGFLRDHATKRGVWGWLQVTEGALEYCVQAPVNKRFALNAPTEAIIVPQMQHHLRIHQPVKFHVEFWKPA